LLASDVYTLLLAEQYVLPLIEKAEGLSTRNSGDARCTGVRRVAVPVVQRELELECKSASTFEPPCTQLLGLAD